jgi:uncharacterized protein
MTIAARLACALIHTYQYCLSPWLGSNCRFAPSCSQYAVEAIQTHGISKGIYLAVKRLLRCHPLGAHGHDPVPPAVKH